MLDRHRTRVVPVPFAVRFFEVRLDSGRGLRDKLLLARIVLLTAFCQERDHFLSFAAAKVIGAQLRAEAIVGPADQAFPIVFFSGAFTLRQELGHAHRHREVDLAVLVELLDLARDLLDGLSGRNINESLWGHRQSVLPIQPEA